MPFYVWLYKFHFWQTSTQSKTFPSVLSLFHLLVTKQNTGYFTKISFNLKYSAEYQWNHLFDDAGWIVKHFHLFDRAYALFSSKESTPI